MNKILTKEQAIQGHRDMWNWIAEQYENGRCCYLITLKEEYCDKNNLNLRHCCFLCEYDSQIFEKDFLDDKTTEICDNCPLLWGTEQEVKELNLNCFCIYGIYDELKRKVRYSIKNFENDESNLTYGLNECAKLARQIANLEVKEDD